MYYKLYGVMNKAGFQGEVGAGSWSSIEKLLGELDAQLYPFFAITEHLRANSPAISIKVGYTAERRAISDSSLVEYKTNPMHEPELAAKIFGRLHDMQAQLEPSANGAVVSPEDKPHA